jgi:aryl-alcohol dehydrogenase-like predicted oxidoreductase
VLAQGDDIVPIPGTKRRRYLDENIGAAKVRLSATDLAEVERAMPTAAIAGRRYDETRLQAVNR